ncbi:hypothetical protein ACKAV7_009160 [Fusarium commune]
MATLSTCNPRGLASYKFWDDSDEIVWPETASLPPPPPQVVAPVEQEPWASKPWKELQARTDTKVKRAAEAAREHLLGGVYAHLPHSELDWSLDGVYTCRVVGLPCYGKSGVRLMQALIKHLNNQTHLKHEAEIAVAWVEPPSSSSQPSPSLHQPPTPIAPAAETEFMEVDERVGSRKSHRHLVFCCCC